LEKIKGDIQETKNIRFFNEKNVKFSLNLDTGDFELNDTRGNFNPSGQEYKFLKTILSLSEYQADYATLISDVWSGRENSKPSRADLAHLLKKIKRGLKILPSGTSANPDIFKNVKGFGYRLSVQ